MARYLLAPAGMDMEEVWPCERQSIEVVSGEARPTGLVDHLGRSIWVGPEEIGFRFGEGRDD